MDFLDDLQRNVLPGDGAMGTELLAAGATLEQCLEEWCLSRPDIIRGVHQRFIEAGSRVIETNSFGANAVRLARHGLAGRVNELNWTAAQLAKEVAKGTGVYVAGSVGPLGISGEEAAAQGIDRHAVFMEQIGALLDGGCNLIILETFLNVEELLIALNAKHTLHHCPVVAMLPLEDPVPFTSATSRLVEGGADVIGANCIAAGRAVALGEAMVKAGTSTEDSPPWAVFPSAGLPGDQEGRLGYPLTPQAFAECGLRLAALGARFIGGCCGTRPDHIAALAKALKGSASAA